MLEFDTTGLPAYRTMNDVQHTEQGPIIGSVCKRVNEAECQVIDSIPLAFDARFAGCAVRRHFSFDAVIH